MRRLAPALGFMVLLSCGPPVSKKPLTPAAKAVADKALLGHWRGQVAGEPGEDAKAVTLDVVVKAGGVMTFTLPPDTKNDRPLVFEGHVSEVGPLHLLNLSDHTDPKDPADEFILVRYEVDRAGALTVWMLSEAPLEKAIKSGALKGTFEGSPPSAVITDEPANTVAFLRKGKPAELFEKFAVFHRDAAKR